MSLLLPLCMVQIASAAAAHEHAIYVQDQQPEPAKAAASLPKAKKPTLVKSLAEFIKFKKKADKKFDARLLEAIETLGVKDSIAATSSNIQALIAELRKEKNHDVESLQAGLQRLMEKIKEQGVINNRPVVPAPDSLPVAPSAFDLEMLANELLPLINQKVSGEELLKEKNEKLRQINRIRNADPATQYTQEASPDGNALPYRLRLKSKAEVFGFYEAGVASWDATAYLNTAHALVYYALPLNEATGSIDSLHGWNTSPVVSQAQQKGCRVYCTVLMQNKTGTSPFLYNAVAREKSISNILALLKLRRADGVNLSFKNMRSKDRGPFLAFTKLLFQFLKKESQAYRLFVTIPRIDLAGAYDVEGLKDNSDLFFIDFATKTVDSCGPLAPLYGGSQQTIDAAVSWYGAHGIAPNKMIVILPYRGTRWMMDAGAATGSFVDYMSFTDIRRIGKIREVYDEETSCVYIDTTSRKNICRIWFDNETTLGKKLDYIVENGLGGAGLYFANYDGFYNELNNELVYRFTAVDTVYLKSTAVAPASRLSFLERLERHLVLFSYILQNPCASCFEEEGISAEEEIRLKRYLKELEFDSLILKDRLQGSDSLKSPLYAARIRVTVKDEFNYANEELNRLLKYISLFFLILSCGFIGVYIYGIRYFENDWQYKKPIAGILVVLFSFSVLSLFTYLFTSDLIPLFGVSDSSFNAPGCSVDPNCINIPFTTLLLVVFLGMIMGLAIYRYLVGPLLKRNHVP